MSVLDKIIAHLGITGGSMYVPGQRLVANPAQKAVPLFSVAMGSGSVMELDLVSQKFAIVPTEGIYVQDITLTCSGGLLDKERIASFNTKGAGEGSRLVFIGMKEIRRFKQLDLETPNAASTLPTIAVGDVIYLNNTFTTSYEITGVGTDGGNYYIDITGDTPAVLLTALTSVWFSQSTTEFAYNHHEEGRLFRAAVNGGSHTHSGQSFEYHSMVDDSFCVGYAYEDIEQGRVAGYPHHRKNM